MSASRLAGTSIFLLNNRLIDLDYSFSDGFIIALKLLLLHTLVLSENLFFAQLLIFT